MKHLYILLLIIQPCYSSDSNKQPDPFEKLFNQFKENINKKLKPLEEAMDTYKTIDANEKKIIQMIEDIEKIIDNTQLTKSQKYKKDDIQPNKKSIN